MRTIIGLHKLGRNRRGISNIIVVVLSLVILVIIASNVIIWSYQMNQVDWERMKEDLAIAEVARIKDSPWFVAQNEYNVRIGTRTSGAYIDTRTINDIYERFVEDLSNFEYGYKFKSSYQRVTTTSSSPVDDLEADLTITLARDSYVLVIYNTGNRDGSGEDYRGKGCAINVDGADMAFSWQSPSAPNYANSVTVVWADWLTIGSHNIKGRFLTNNAGNLVGIDTRQLTVFWFSGIAANYVRSTMRATTTSSSPVDDSEAVINLNLEENSMALIVYNAANQRGSTETTRGKGITISIDGSDITTKQWQSPYAANHANSATIVYAIPLNSGSHVIRGRFFSNRAGYTVTIDERQLAMLCFPINAIKYAFKESTTAASTTSSTPLNDTETQIILNLAKNSDCLFLYTAGNPYGVSETTRGKGLLLNVDGLDRSNSTNWQSPYDNSHANSVTSLWCEELSTGNHTIQGKFFSNVESLGVTISDRQILALAFPKPDVDVYRLDLAGDFQVDLGNYPIAYIKSVEAQLRYCANSTEEKFYIKAYNWTASAYMDNGFNSTSGHLSSTGWSYYAVNLTNEWNSYINANGEIRLKILDQSFDPNKTAIDIDFLAVRVVFDATRFTIKNNGGSTLHVVALWVVNNTYHERFSVNYFINTGETATYLRFDTVLPKNECVVKAISERGNTAVYAVDVA